MNKIIRPIVDSFYTHLGSGGTTAAGTTLLTLKVPYSGLYEISLEFSRDFSDDLGRPIDMLWDDSRAVALPIPFNRYSRPRFKLYLNDKLVLITNASITSATAVGNYWGFGSAEYVKQACDCK